MFISTIERRQGLKVACPEEIAYRLKWIDAAQLEAMANRYGKSTYGEYLRRLVHDTIQWEAS
jgi:glucose-1-phosphate thymidylyltransferase